MGPSACWETHRSSGSVHRLAFHRRVSTRTRSRIALLAGDIEADAHWFSGYAQSGRETAQRLAQMAAGADNRAVIFFADGFNGDAEQFCAALQDGAFPLVGGLSSGDLHTGSTYQMAGNQSGTGSLAAAIVRGDVRIGVGYAHGWDPVGSQFRITRSRGFWLRTLNGRPASETYADLFGQPARDWAFPPLSYLARLYPLGIEQGDELVVRSPIRVEADGSFRMNAPVSDGADAYLLVGSRAACEKAATQGEPGRTAGPRRPEARICAGVGGYRLAAPAGISSGCRYCSRSRHPGSRCAHCRRVHLGSDRARQIGYSARPATSHPQFLNQNIVVVAFASPS